MFFVLGGCSFVPLAWSLSYDRIWQHSIQTSSQSDSQSWWLRNDCVRGRTTEERATLVRWLSISKRCARALSLLPVRQTAMGDTSNASAASKFSLLHILDIGGRASAAGVAAEARRPIAPLQPQQPSGGGRRRAMTAEEKRIARTCIVDGCPNYIVHRKRCFRHGVRSYRGTRCVMLSIVYDEPSERIDALFYDVARLIPTATRAARRAPWKAATRAQSSVGSAGDTVRHSLIIHLVGLYLQPFDS